ncbi:hypothetical protein P3T36_006902 [Kitasatospora sp. MAP12-15]|uniref:hypothetical protein n=1 Tax=unclassified Kitasatospora TaxID=2633591 RepID=UPI002474AAF7|nr:hypothetical protein [Kitasatospora sp. MAP12-44]MDH6111915.1 hypothetical protein [Kitasatospora sp. MAP12-44]
MITYTVNGQGDTLSTDDQSLTFPEGLEIERQVGIGASKYLQGLAEGGTLSTAALFWLGAVRAAAVRDGVNFREAAQALAFVPFADLLDLMATMKSARTVVAADPTPPAPDGSAESTSPATSEQPQPPTPSPEGESPTSESSPNSSESVPGSGIS